MFPESEPVVREVPEAVDIPKVLETATGVQKIETAFTANVRDAGNQPIISTPATTNAKIQLPGDVPTLIAWSKGSITDAVTWLGKFFLRVIARNKLKEEHAGN